jgi:hypothetical protein
MVEQSLMIEECPKGLTVAAELAIRILRRYLKRLQHEAATA